MVLLDINFFGVCDGGGSTWSMETFIKNANTLFSYLLDEPTNVLISNAHEMNENTLGTTWDVEYDVLRIGTIDKDRAADANVTNVVTFLEQSLQERLDLSIVEGLMNQRFGGTVIVMDIFEEIGTPSSEFEVESTVEGAGGDVPELNDRQKEEQMDDETESIVEESFQNVDIVLDASTVVEEEDMSDEPTSNNEESDEQVEVLPESIPVVEEEDIDYEATSNNEESDQDVDVEMEKPQLESDNEKPGEAFVVVPGRAPIFDGRDHDRDSIQDMPPVTKEIGFFVENSSSSMGRGMNDAPELDYAESALILRYIGIGMVGLTFVMHTILACMGMCYRRRKERKEIAALDPEYQRGLISEHGVNLMLERGRRESEMMA
eukprot:CAMPEP_0116136324 /NCGR_PEP_ID=MMETSP0329-20121206/11662_1 /TAXON_ID=697910 /ORGANISM="Pseudo-nitzschia arenysensis, Strain B593" /LENGTH=375 /DNA_ID=CAMNT_0003631181 /DNA_START=228 /DNA_END=1355 /DNA_ORIENTATION=+